MQRRVPARHYIEVKAGGRDERSEPFYQLKRFKDDMAGAVAPAALETI